MNRWLVLVCCALVYTLAIGQMRSIGVYYEPLRQHFNCSRQQLGTTLSALFVSCSTGAVASPLLLHVAGVRWTTMIGSLLSCVGYLAASRAQQLWHVAAAFLLAGAGKGVLGIPCHIVLIDRFPDKQKFAFTVLQVGVSVGIFGFNPWYQLAIEQFGWRDSFMIRFSSALMLLVSLLAFVIAAKPPAAPTTTAAAETSTKLVPQQEKQLEETEDDAACDESSSNPLRQLFTCQAGNSIWQPDRLRLPLMFVFCVCAFGAAVTNDQNLVSFAITQGVDAHRAPWVASASGATDILVRLGFSLLFVRWPHLNALRLALAPEMLMGVALAALPLLGTTFGWLTLIATAGLSVGWSSFISVYAAFVHTLFGSHKFALAKGLSQLGAAFGALIVPMLAGALSDRYSQAYAYYVAAASAGIAVCCLLVLNIRKLRL